MKSFYEQFKRINLVAIDCDGVLTDGGIYLNKYGEEFRRFDVKDGIGVKLLQQLSISLAWISGSNSNIINKRARSLGVNIVKTGISNKLEELTSIQNSLNISKKQTLYLGDDINDLTVLPAVSLFFVPSDAHIACKSKASYISIYEGGRGFFREVADNLLRANGIDPYKAFETKN